MSNHQNKDLALRFRALGNPHRVELFRRMLCCCPVGTRCDLESAAQSIGALSDGMPIAPSTLSHHLKELVSAGLVCTERRGKRVFCWVEPQVVAELGDFFSIPTFTDEPACCAAHHTPEP